MLRRRKKSKDNTPILRSVPMAEVPKKDKKKAKKLMKKEFAGFWLLPQPALKVLAKRKMASYLAYYDGDHLCAVSYLIFNKHLVYLAYLAVDEKKRSQGYGTAVLKELSRFAEGREIVLDIEAPDSSARNHKQRVRRLDFYERNGFSDSGYNLVEEDGTTLILSTKGKEFDHAAFYRLLWQFSLGYYQAELERHW